jgi:hypothetical protein
VSSQEALLTLSDYISPRPGSEYYPLKGVVPRPLGREQSALRGAPIHGVGSIDLELMKRKSFPHIKDALPRSWFLATA